MVGMVMRMIPAISRALRLMGPLTRIVESRGWRTQLKDERSRSKAFPQPILLHLLARVLAPHSSHGWHPDRIAFVAPGAHVAMHLVVFTSTREVAHAISTRRNHLLFTSCEFTDVHPTAIAIRFGLFEDPQPHRSIVS